MNKKFIIPLALMVLVISSVLASAQLFGTQAADSSMRTIAVSGSYTASVAPDQAEFSVTVETQQNTAKAAIEENRRIANGVIEALKAAGVDAKDIQTSGFYVYKKEEYLPYPQTIAREVQTDYVPPPSGRSQVVGWAASNTISVTTRSLDKVGSFIDVAADAGANSFGGVYFSLSRAKQDELEKQLLEGAAEDAKGKAQTLASAFGTSVGRVHSISESGAATPVYRALVADAFKSFEEAATPIEPGEVETSRTVSVVFELA